MAPSRRSGIILINHASVGNLSGAIGHYTPTGAKTSTFCLAGERTSWLRTIILYYYSAKHPVDFAVESVVLAGQCNRYVRGRFVCARTSVQNTRSYVMDNHVRHGQGNEIMQPPSTYVRSVSSFYGHTCPRLEIYFFFLYDDWASCYPPAGPQGTPNKHTCGK